MQVYAYNTWQSGMEIQVHHLRQRDLPPHVLTAGKKLAQPAEPNGTTSEQPAMAAPAETPAGEGVSSVQVLPEVVPENLPAVEMRPQSGEKRRRPEDDVRPTPLPAAKPALPSPNKKPAALSVHAAAV